MQVPINFSFLVEQPEPIFNPYSWSVSLFVEAQGQSVEVGTEHIHNCYSEQEAIQEALSIFFPQQDLKE